MTARLFESHPPLSQTLSMNAGGAESPLPNDIAIISEVGLDEHASSRAQGATHARSRGTRRLQSTVKLTPSRHVPESRGVYALPRRRVDGPRPGEGAVPRRRRGPPQGRASRSQDAS